MKPFNLSSRLFAKVFWEGILQSTDQWAKEHQELSAQLGNLEKLRNLADYNTGSITNCAAWSLYSLTRYFQFSRAIEIGTFIGKSTYSIAQAMEATNARQAEIFTCDQSNEIKIPWDGETKIFQFPKISSTDMLRQLTGKFDFCFFDGRLSDVDLNLLDNLIDTNSVIALDDFEGTEKGVINLLTLKSLPKLANHFLVYPASEKYLRSLGFTSHSTLAILFPAARISLSNQG